MEDSVFYDSLQNSLIDILSMIDYQLAVEFSRNDDAYLNNTYICYRNLPSKPRISFYLWDFDLAYDNANLTTNGWVYDTYNVMWKKANSALNTEMP